MTAREDLIAGLRGLADFYEANPDMPVPAYPSLLIGCGDVPTVHGAAALLGSPVEASDEGHTTTERQFGSLHVRAYHVTTERMARHNAAASYADAVQPEGEVAS